MPCYVMQTICFQPNREFKPALLYIPYTLNFKSLAAGLRETCMCNCTYTEMVKPNVALQLHLLNGRACATQINNNCFYAIVFLEDQLWLHYLFVQAETLKVNWKWSSLWIDHLLEGTKNNFHTCAHACTHQQNLPVRNGAIWHTCQVWTSWHTLHAASL